MSSMATAYETDVIAWANEQARLLRAGLLSQLDIEHIADEIEDVGKSEKREIRNQMALLLAHLLKWQYQPIYRGNSWIRTIKSQREEIKDCLVETPSLKADLANPRWWSRVWADAARMAESETGLLNQFPEDFPWTFEQVMDADFWPDSPASQ